MNILVALCLVTNITKCIVTVVYNTILISGYSGTLYTVFGRAISGFIGLVTFCITGWCSSESPAVRADPDGCQVA